MKALAHLAIGLLVIAATVLYMQHCTGPDPEAVRLEEEAATATRAAATARASLDSVREVNVARQAELDSLRAAARQRQVVYVEREREAVQEVARAGADLAATIDTLEQRVTPELRPLVGTLRIQEMAKSDAQSRVAEALRGHVSALEAQLFAADSTTVLERGEKLAERRAREAAEAAVRAQTERADYLDRKLNPGLLRTLWGDLPELAAAGGVGGVLALIVFR